MSTNKQIRTFAEFLALPAGTVIKYYHGPETKYAMYRGRGILRGMVWVENEITPKGVHSAIGFYESDLEEKKVEVAPLEEAQDRKFSYGPQG